MEDKNIGYGRKLDNLAENLWENKSTSLLIAEDLYLDNHSIVALKTELNVLSNVFWEVELKIKEAQDFLVLWFNLTLGFLLYLSYSLSSFGKTINMKKEQFKNMNIIDLNKIDTQFLKNSADFLDEIKDEPFNSFPKEFDFAANQKGVRFCIDNFLFKNLKIKIDLMKYYEILATEPILSNKRLIIN